MRELCMHDTRTWACLDEVITNRVEGTPQQTAMQHMFTRILLAAAADV
jgi:hypothetical protein